MKLRGMVHVHSRWSYDGCHDLHEIVGRAQARRLDFVLMSEHTRTMTDETMTAFVAECDALTRATGILVVPGIECEATPDFVHVLGYGVRSLVRDRRVGSIATAVRAAGGFPVLAHPVYRDAAACVSRGELDQLGGWEVWNGKADGPWYPGADALRRLADLHLHDPSKLAHVQHPQDAHAAIAAAAPRVSCSASLTPSRGPGPSRSRVKMNGSPPVSSTAVSSRRPRAP